MSVQAAPVPSPIRRDRPAVGGRSRWRILAAAIAVWLLAAGLAGFFYLDRRVREPVALPAVGDVDIFASLFDVRPVTVTTTTAWQKTTVTLPRYRFLEDRSVWLRMHFDDWDLLPGDLRAEGLGRMIDTFGRYAVTPEVWPAMTAEDWDWLPQPIRAMAFVSMVEHWVGFYAVGEGFDLDRAEVMRTVKAIAMSESWFDHRAFLINKDGSVDIGIAGASGYARDVIRRWHERGLCDFTAADADYYNPWVATRFLAFWFQVMLEEADGDLTLAVRAYNWGIGRARSGNGEEYLAAIRRRRSRFFVGPSGSFTWRLLSEFRHENLPPGMPSLPMPATLPRAQTAGATF